MGLTFSRVWERMVRRKIVSAQGVALSMVGGGSSAAICGSLGHGAL
jgi:hypothetical protein